MLKKSLFLTFLLLLGIGIGWFLKDSILQKELVEQSNKVLKEEVNDYSEYTPIFKRDGQVFTGIPLSGDLTGDGQPELIFTTIGEGCASCHAKNVYIFQEEKELIKLELTDPFFHPLSRRGFLIVEPANDAYEASCCPVSFQNAVYLWDGVTFKKRLP